MAIGIYNRLVRLRALVREGFSGITVQLRRRADLIPNLVETVKGYATHEREVLDEVTARRADATKAGSVEANGAGRRADDRPARAADGRRRGLSRPQGQCEFPPAAGASCRTSRASCRVARRYYNATVRDLNTNVQSFPPVLIAGPMGFTEEPFYQDEDPAIQSAPKVSFERPAA